MLTAGAMLDAFRRGDLSPVEVLPGPADPLGAWAARNPHAPAEARAAERAWRRGEPTGPLCGVPVAVKDLFDTRGLATECGSAMLAGRVPERDARAVARVRAAGAVIAGKTTTVEFAWGLMARTARNPLDPDRTPGGSSAGSAIAVATGAVPLALATDTGGSARVPAAFCGVLGFKPSFGVVSTAGCWPLAPPMDHVGLMGRTGADLRLLFSVLAGPPAAAAAPPAAAPRRVGIARAGGVALEPPIAAALERARAALQGDGVEVVEVDLPGPEAVMDAYGPPFLVAALAEHVRSGLWPDERARYTAAVRERLELAERVGPGEVAEAAARGAELAAAYGRVLGEVDLLLTAVSAVAPPRLDDPTDLRDSASPLVCPQNLLGLPACAVGAVQLTGPRAGDRRVLAAADRLTSLLNC